jgi:hypothetical protein
MNLRRCVIVKWHTSGFKLAIFHHPQWQCKWHADCYLHDVTRYMTALFFPIFFVHMCITLVEKFDITKQSNEMQYHGHGGPCIMSLSFAVVTGLCRIRSLLPRWTTQCFPHADWLILLHRRFSKCWFAVSNDRAGREYLDIKWSLVLKC